MPTDASAPIRVLLIDDHAMLREGVASMIGRQSDVIVVGEAATGKEGVEMFDALMPDVTLMDLQMPDMGGLEAITAIRRHHPAARIVMLTTYAGDLQAMRAMTAGAVGYLLKDSLRKELLDTIRGVHLGGRVITPEVAQQIAIHATYERLAEREIDVLDRVANGLSNKQIASELSISEETVKGYLKTIFAKLGVADRTHAVTVAMRRGLLVL